jgi:hypothetical protein
MFVLVVLLVASGLTMNSEFAEGAHRVFAYTMIGLIGAHLLGITLHTLRHKLNELSTGLTCFEKMAWSCVTASPPHRSIHHYLRGLTMLATDHRLFQVLGSVLMLFMMTFVDVSAQTTQPAPAATDTFVTTVQHRTQDEIKADLAYVASLRTAAQARKERLKEEIHILDGRMKSLEKEIESLDGRLDTLDSDRDSAAYATAKERKALLEKLKDLLEIRTDARKAETEAAQAALGFVEAREATCTHESALLSKKSERDAAAKKSGAAAALPPLEQAVKSMETELNDRWEKALSAQDDWVSTEKDLLKALRKLAEAQDGFHGE